MPEYQKKYGKKSTTSEEYRKSRSKANSGENNPNYNNKWSDQQRQSASDTVKKQLQK